MQVKSQYASDCNLSFPIKEKSLNAFDFLVVAFLNIGTFYRGRDGTTGIEEPEFFTFPASFIRRHHQKTERWEKVCLRPIVDKIGKYRNNAGFELIAKALGVPRPCRLPTMAAECEDDVD